MTPPRPRRVPRLPILLVVLPLACACTERPATVLEPVVRLTQHRAIPRGGNEPVRCGVGDELRPAFGCPPFILLRAELVPEEEQLRFVADTPHSVRGKEMVVLPTVRVEPREVPESLPLRIVPEVGPRLDVAVPFEGARLGERSRGQIRAHVLEPLVRRVFTKPVEVPANAVLEVGLAVEAFAAESGAGATEFRLDAKAGKERRTILRERIEAEDGGRWHDRRIDLADLAGRQVSFRFITTTEPTPERPNSTAAFPIWGAPQILTARPRDGRRNLVLVSLDTVRADFLGSDAGEGNPTPFFDRLASEGTRFTQAVSTFSSTSAAHMSLFTGTYPATHDVRFATHRLSSAIETLPQILSRAGYSTGAATENAMILAGSGFARGFDSYRENRTALERAGGIDETFSEGLQWVQRNSDALFFLFLHTYEAHTPYAPSPEALAALPEIDPALDGPERNWARTRRLYAAEIHYTDGALERLFDELDRLDLLDDTLVVITSDHGEEFGEHGLLGHAKTVYDEVLRVPLLFWSPGLVPGGRVVDEQVSLVDVAPTILDLLGLPEPVDIPGRSMAPAIRGEPSPTGSVRFAEGMRGKVRQVTARSEEYKWIWEEDEDRVRVYDLRSDPAERAPLDDPDLVARGRALIDGYVGVGERPVEAGTRELDEETQRKLEALGYVEEPSTEAPASTPARGHREKGSAETRRPGSPP